MCEERKSSPAGETSRAEGYLQIRRIYEGITETGKCEKCKKDAKFCFAILGFPDSKLCKSCGIYCKKYPTTFISKDVWTERRDYRVWMHILFSLVTISITSAMYLLGMQEDVFEALKLVFALYFAILVAFINWFWTDSPTEKAHQMMEYLVPKLEDLFGIFANTLVLTDVDSDHDDDHLEGTVYVTHQPIKRGLSHRTRLWSLSEDEVTEREEELKDLRNEVDDLKKQLNDSEERHSSEMDRINEEVDKSVLETSNMTLKMESLERETEHLKALLLLQKERNDALETRLKFFEDIIFSPEDAAAEELIEVNNDLGDVEEGDGWFQIKNARF